MSKRNGPEPFYRDDRKLWYVQVAGKQHNLGPDKATAFRRWHELMSNPIIPKVDATLAVSIIDAFLDWCQKNQAERTYDWYKMHVGCFAAALPSPETYTVSELTPYAVTSWVDVHPSWGPSFRRGAISAVQRVFNWAEKVKLIPQSPIRHIDKPQTKRRELHIDQAEFDRVIAFYPSDDPFRLLLVFAWESGVRPEEARKLEAAHFYPERQRFEIPAEDSKGKKKRRIIHLTDAAAAVVKRQIERYGDGIIFRNADGTDWTAESINCRFCRLKKKIGYKLCAYVIRHSFCQRMLEAGLDSVTVAALMGHADASMVQKVYSHMGQSQDYLANQLKKAAG